MKFSDLLNSPDWPKCERCQGNPMSFAISEDEMERSDMLNYVLNAGVKALTDIGVTINASNASKLNIQIEQAGIHAIRVNEGQARADEIIRILSYIPPAPPPWCDQCLQTVDWEEYYLQQLKEAYEKGERQS
jgi:hypothetical protein